jgi:lipopolysaccharide export system protein LptA
LPRRSRTLLGIGALVGVVAIGFGATWVVMLHHRPETTSQPASETTSVPGGVQISNPTLRHTENGKLAWQIRLQQVALSRGGVTVGAAGVKEGLVYDASGKPAVRITARSAKGDTLTKNFQLDGDVRITSDQGALITADQVSWNQAEQKLNCPGPVTARARDAVITSTGVDYLVNQAMIVAPNQIKMYTGKNKVIGQGLQYDVKSSSFALQSVQMVLDTREAGRKLQEVPR